MTANLVVYNEAIKMMRYEIFDLGVENKALRGKLGQVLIGSKYMIKLFYYSYMRKNRIILERNGKQKN